MKSYTVIWKLYTKFFFISTIFILTVTLLVGWDEICGLLKVLL